MIERITQSFMKDFRDYLNKKECGNIIREKYIAGRLLDDPTREPGAMELGSYFEFIAFGNLPKSGIMPKPLYQESKLKAKKNGDLSKMGLKDMYDEYRTIHLKAPITVALMEEMGFKIIAKGKTFTHGRFAGTWDLVVECQKNIVCQGVELFRGQVIIIDCKYSGLLSETTPRTNKHGWKFSDVQKEYHGTQAKQYSLPGMEFFFWVVSSSNKSNEIKIFHVPVDKQMLEDHVAEGNDYYAKLELLAKTNGLEPRPGYVKCMKCPLYATCPDKQTTPDIETVDLTKYGRE